MLCQKVNQGFFSIFFLTIIKFYLTKYLIIFLICSLVSKWEFEAKCLQKSIIHTMLKGKLGVFLSIFPMIIKFY
ncbi:hypothetical protein C1645_563717 [Glomus cerebriforme]|uniref:Uncharacterized protein n=1 Tax=Glomus cerebriforme TaxID=658196 RepID=A0A397S7A4_9GLOM|nr:hypothetical protein C1645_563717 [Glomus cerebriforme]